MRVIILFVMVAFATKYCPGHLAAQVLPGVVARHDLIGVITDTPSYIHSVLLVVKNFRSIVLEIAGTNSYWLWSQICRMSSSCPVRTLTLDQHLPASPSAYPGLLVSTAPLFFLCVWLFQILCRNTIMQHVCLCLMYFLLHNVLWDYSVHVVANGIISFSFFYTFPTDGHKLTLGYCG